MRLIRTIAVTFAQYSRIPVPYFDWEEDDMVYSMSVFPWVGAVIGAVFCCICWLCSALDIPDLAMCLLLTAVPLVITGGFHADGFMDVSDALSSYGSREDKLRILKDPHIGAFAVIRLAIVGLIYAAALDISLTYGGEPVRRRMAVVIAAGFALSRGLSALGVLNMRSARNEGMLFYEASCAGRGRKVNNVLCSLWVVLSLAVMGAADLMAGAAAGCAALISMGWYRYKSYREFGGITGDTAGYFVTICEAAVCVGAAIAAVIRMQGR